MPEDVRSELIDGVMYDMASQERIHQGIVGELYYRIRDYIRNKGGDCKVYPAPFDVELFENEDTVVQPDISVICDKEKLTKRGCLGAPDWVIEVISPGNPGHDYVKKLNLYKRAGVREYWIVDPANESVTVFINSEDKEEPDYYTFSDEVKAGIYDDLSISFPEMVKEL